MWIWERGQENDCQVEISRKEDNTLDHLGIAKTHCPVPSLFPISPYMVGSANQVRISVMKAPFSILLVVCL